MSSAAWDLSRDTMSADRVFEYTSDALVARFKPNGVLDVLALAQVPALFTQEMGGDQMARVGRITQAVLSGRDYQLDYVLDPDVAPIPNAKIMEFAAQLGIDGRFEPSRTHWAVKDVDLYKFLFKRGLGQAPKPKVFSLGAEPVDDGLVAVMMPFDAGFKNVASAISDACTTAGMKSQRADNIWIADHIIQDVVSLIAESKVVICDLTGRNSNVFYEMGIAHTLGKDVIMVTQNAADVPFDVRHIRFITYHPNGEGLKAMTAEVAKRLETLKSL